MPVGGRLLRLHWTPGRGGLLARVPPSCVPPLSPALRARLPPEARPIDDPHITLLRGASMAPLVGVLDAGITARLPPPPLPRFSAVLHRATRGPHPTKDPPGSALPRTTWFRAVVEQDRCHAVLAEIVAMLAAESARPFPHPEPDRFFHLSCWNDRGGDGMRSIGDIGPGDLGAPVLQPTG